MYCLVDINLVCDSWMFLADEAKNKDDQKVHRTATTNNEINGTFIVGQKLGRHKMEINSQIFG